MMPKHEAPVFNYQMYEMHRLYARQKEFLGGIQMSKSPAYCCMPQVPMQQNLQFLPQVPMQQNIPFMPQVHRQQNSPFMPQVPKQQNLPFMPQASKQQNLPFTPQAPKQQNLPFTPQAPKQQNLPFTPQVPTQQNLPFTHLVPTQQNLPFTPLVPKQQNLPSWLFPGSQYGERQGVENFRNPSDVVHISSGSSGDHHHTVKSEFQQSESPSLGRNKFGKRMLDLELPAEVYLDSDDEEQVEEKRRRRMHPVLDSPSVNHVAASREEASINFGSSCVFDLNEPAKEDELIVSKSPIPSSVTSRKIKHKDLSDLEDRGKKWPFSCNDRGGLGSEVSENEHNLVDSSKQRCLMPPVGADAKRSSDKTRNGPIVVVQALPCFTNSPFNGISSSPAKKVRTKLKNKAGHRSVGRNSSRISWDTKNHFADKVFRAAKSSVHSGGKKARIDLNLNDTPSDFPPETEACQESSEFSNGRLNLDLNAVPACYSSETGVSEKSELDRKMTDLNAKQLEPNSSSSQLSALTSVTYASSSSEFEHDKSAIPAIAAMPSDSSPEMKNCCKVENASETDLKAPACPDKKELETIAAEIIISMSLSEEEQCLENTINWFAEIILREAKTFKSPGRKRGRRGRKAELQLKAASRNQTTSKATKAAKGDKGRGKRAVVKKVRSGLKQQLVEQSWLFVWGERSRRQKHKRAYK